MSKAAFTMFAEGCRLLAAGFDALGREGPQNDVTPEKRPVPRRPVHRLPAPPDSPPTDIDRQNARAALRRFGLGTGKA
jgi:hypothetical protein